MLDPIAILGILLNGNTRTEVLEELKKNSKNMTEEQYIKAIYYTGKIYPQDENNS